MSGFSAIDLEKLPPPVAVEVFDYETLVAAMRDDLIARDGTLTAVDLESEPLVKLLEVAAYRELLIRQRVNDAVRGVLLATAVGEDLDHIGVLFNVYRDLVSPGDPEAIPPVDPVYESDIRFRYRIQISLEGITTAGPVGSYVYWALSADPDVKDVAVESPTAGTVLVTVLSGSGDGIPSAALMEAVSAGLNAETVRPLTDQVIVQAATVMNYTIEVVLTFYSGPDSAVVRDAAAQEVTLFVNSHHRLGHDITVSGLHAALHRAGVQNVEIVSPAEDIVVGAAEAAYCTEIIVTAGGIEL